MTRSRAKSGLKTERVIAWSAVALIHVLVGWVATRPFRIKQGRAGPDLQVVFIEHPKAKIPGPLLKTVAVARTIVKTVTAQLPAEVRGTPAEVEPPTSSQKVILVTDDDWSRSNTKSVSDGITFKRNPLISSYNPIPRPEAGRFRMRRQISPEDIVRGVSQVLGFWPPGYTDDPCSGLDKAVEMLMNPRNDRGHGLLVDALQQRDKYCE